MIIKIIIKIWKLQFKKYFIRKTWSLLSVDTYKSVSATLICGIYILLDFELTKGWGCFYQLQLDRVKRIWYLSPMRAAKVQASLRIRAVSPEPSLLAHTSSESRGTFRQKARSLAPLNGWACAVKICHDGMLEDTNSLDGAQLWLLGQVVVHEGMHLRQVVLECRYRPCTLA